MRVPLICLLCFTFICIIYSCKHKPFPQPVIESNFPDSIAAIFVTRCATTGCHDAAGAINADNLRLDTWGNLFKGSSHGSVVIPYNASFSSLLYFINTDSTRGLKVLPTMPNNGAPLSATEYYTIRNWIAAGAPDKNGNVAFASNPDTRQKIYITQQGCDLMEVVDAQSKLVMRIFPIGMAFNTEAPHAVRITADGMYAYVAYASGNYVQKIDTRTDTVVATINLGAGQGGSLSISPNGQKVLVTDFSQSQLWNVDFSSGQIADINYASIIYPHGIVATPNWDTFYITPQYGNAVYRYTPGKIPLVLKIPLDTTLPAVDNVSLTYSDPHEILMTPDNSKLFITCQYGDNVKVLDAHTYKVLAVLPVGIFPQEMAISTSKHQIFITCMNDTQNPRPGSKGSVYVFDYNTLQQVGGPIYGDFYQPHGITADDQNNTLYIVSSNNDSGGPAAHHATTCGTTAGWYSIYNLNTLQPINNARYETSNDPYSAATRFK